MVPPLDCVIMALPLNLRNAVTAAAKTAEFEADYERLMGEAADIVSAEEGTRILSNLDKAPEDVRACLRDYVN
jgi:hypothetical protein